MKYTYPLLACTLVMLQASLYADEAGAKPEQKCNKAVSAENPKACQLKKFNTNADGKLDETERAAMKAKKEEMKKKFDTNADGKLDETERAAMMAACKAENGDAPKVAKPEPVVKKEVAVKKDGKAVEKKHNRAPDPAILKAFDKDGDGKLSKEEHMALRKARKAFDKDGDGKLSPEEKAAMVESLKE